MDENATRAVIFDFDGTIADSFWLIPEGLNKFSDKFSLGKVTPVEIEKLRDKPLREILTKYRISLFKVLRYRNEVVNFVYDRIDKVKIFPGIDNLLKKFSKSDVKLYILTSNSKKTVEKFLENHNIREFHKIYSEPQLFGKAPILKKIIRMEKLNIKFTIYVGDETRDIEAARIAGVGAVAVSWGFNRPDVLSKSQPDLLADSPDKIYKFAESYWSAAV